LRYQFWSSIFVFFEAIDIDILSKAVAFGELQIHSVRKELMQRPYQGNFSFLVVPLPKDAEMLVVCGVEVSHCGSKNISEKYLSAVL